MKIALLACLALCGCSATNPTRFANALKGDNASWAIYVQTIYGGGHYVRFGPGAVGTVNADGTMSITGNSVSTNRVSK